MSLVKEGQINRSQEASNLSIFICNSYQRTTKPTQQMDLQKLEKFTLPWSTIQAGATEPAAIPERPT